ncbi:calmodulin-like protein [Leptomonas pyrrhocoris]|uniref:Calmodulin-like protein n=1 Tax=Leptomonas pyrrhocoris TaxID=157538 RepID=A0A0M9FXT6_LEPPY|nr:calmodulin-like protein [Leptomonas pyrrhocoris]KPA78129.1 calmodulin-like protein [Leptomonas pyrrhocoris]|eukprot:XP_015656568.1 calmodulin-like protein [Leptomonas pyrrhocoris]
MTALAEEQRSQAALQFLLLDQDSDGYIASDQLGEYLRTVGLYPTPSDIAGYLPIVDPHGTGKVAQEDALQLAEQLYPQRTTPEELHAALKVLDDDADGYMTTAQLRLFLVSLGTRLTTEEADEIIHDVEKDADGMINLEDLAQMLMPRNAERSI